MGGPDSPTGRLKEGGPLPGTQLCAITTILGLIPMVFEMTILLVERQILFGAPSSQWWTQLSSTIAGGLTFATILTLLATPAMLVLGSFVAMKLRGRTAAA